MAFIVSRTGHSLNIFFIFLVFLVLKELILIEVNFSHLLNMKLISTAFSVIKEPKSSSVREEHSETKWLKLATLTVIK